MTNLDFPDVSDYNSFIFPEIVYDKQPGILNPREEQSIKESI